MDLTIPSKPGLTPLFVMVPVFLVALPFLSHAEDNLSTVQFNKDIRPILSDNCFKCHGPDLQHSKLRFDKREIAIEKSAIVQGDPAESEMIARITSENPEHQMPPPEENRELTPEQIETLRTWIAEGAEYQKHWAFEPVPPARIPRVSDPHDWVHNPIDAFILDHLNEEGLAPRDVAGKERLLRRVTLDLTGLPPTIDEMDAFLLDESPEAYEKAVERLLASPHYGEQRALEWLDVARYADTHGYSEDYGNQAWPWREWVIRAFNDNLPYDDFARWQIAGDMLPDATHDQVLATAFNRIHRQTNEGGSVSEEFVVEYIADRTQTFSTAFLGLTMECARCHDHKFDPISQREYYETFAFFSNIDEVGLYSEYTRSTTTPNIFVYDDGQAAEHEELKQAVREAEAKLAEVREGAKDRFAEWLAGGHDVVAPPLPLVYLPLDYKSGGTTPNLAGESTPGILSIEPELIPGAVKQAVAFTGDNSITIKGAGIFERTDPFTIAMWLKVGDGSKWMVVLHHTEASTAAGSRGYDLMLDEGRAVFGLSHFWPGNAIQVRTHHPLSLDEWIHVAVTYDGSSRAGGLTIYLNGEPAPVEVIRDNLYDSILYTGRRPQDQDGAGEPPLMIGARLRDPGFKNGAMDELKVFGACLTRLEIERIAKPDRKASINGAADEDSPLLDYYLSRFDGKYAAAMTEARAARNAEQAYVDTLSQMMVMREEASEPRAYILERGVYNRPGDEVGAGVPSQVLPFPSDLPRNRLGLADWLVRRDHPLTARVAVNRYWKVFFGRALVTTMEDFGSQGMMPSHPELLDFLAGWFMENSWDVKALCKLIVSSATYRQDSVVPPEVLRHDPENVLMARGPRHRMSAEQIRDGALAASGLLTRTIGGASVKPYQPDGLWREGSSFTYKRDSGPALYRRSMYTFWRRTMPPPSMMTFDAVNREFCTVEREVTVTPLQALVLLNDPQYVEAARVLASKVLIRHGNDVSAAYREAFRRLIGRKPVDAEVAVLQAAYDDQFSMYASSRGEARSYTRVGEHPVDDAQDPVKLAAMTSVVQLVMTMDEFQVKS